MNDDDRVVFQLKNLRKRRVEVSSEEDILCQRFVEQFQRFLAGTGKRLASYV